MRISRQDFIDGYRKGVAKGVVLAATNPYQTAIDARLNGFNAGAFTYLLTQYLWQQTSTPERVIASLILVNEPLILVNESLILVVESLILVNESLILVVEPLILVVESLILVNEPLLLVVESLILVNESLILVVEPLILVNESLILVIEPLILVNEFRNLFLWNYTLGSIQGS
ncbi:MAG TPA: hypothetical protein V6D11_30425 [Waterburya sp.]